MRESRHSNLAWKNLLLLFPRLIYLLYSWWDFRGRIKFISSQATPEKTIFGSVKNQSIPAIRLSRPRSMSILNGCKLENAIRLYLYVFFSVLLTAVFNKQMLVFWIRFYFSIIFFFFFWSVQSGSTLHTRTYTNTRENTEHHTPHTD